MNFGKFIGEKVNEAGTFLGEKFGEAGTAAQNFGVEARDTAERLWNESGITETAGDISKAATEKATEIWNNCVNTLDNTTVKITENVNDSISQIDQLFKGKQGADINVSIADLKPIVETQNLDETVATVAYFEGCRYANEEMTPEKEAALLDEVKQFFSDADMVNKIQDAYDVTADKAQEIAEDVAYYAVEGGKAAVYYNYQFSKGHANVICNAIKEVDVITSVADGNDEEAKEKLKQDYLETVSNKVYEICDGGAFIDETAGAVVENVGETINEIGLAIGSTVAFAHPATIAVGVAGTATLSLNAAEKELKNDVENTGEIGSKELICSGVVAATTAATTAFSGATVAKLTKNIGSKMTETVGKKITSEVVGSRIAGTLTMAAVGGIESAVYKAGDTIQDVTRYAVGLQEEFDVKKEAIEAGITIAGSAALAGASYAVSDVVRNSKQFATMYEKITGKKYELKPDLFDGMYGQANNQIELIEGVEPKHISTINENNVGKSISGIKYEKNTFILQGEEYEGVFPKFKSEYTVELPENLYMASDNEQMKYCTKELAAAIEKNPHLTEAFNQRQLEQIKNNEPKISNLTWHHNEVPGKMQLVNAIDHSNARHTGGRFIWGGGSDYR